MANECITLIFRDLKADEIDCRIATVGEKGISLLLYKDARCDMNILDETVGSYNWQRMHSRDNANCTVSIWDSSKNQWISKEDVGTESNTEAIKGLASDSFKRACFNWGIGRELYTAPFIWIPAEVCNIKKRNDGKYVSYDKFIVKDLTIKNKRITGLSIYNATTKAIVYSYGQTEEKAPAKKAAKKAKPAEPVDKYADCNTPEAEAYKARQELKEFIKWHGLDEMAIVQTCGLNANSTREDYEAALEYSRGLVR